MRGPVQAGPFLLEGDDLLETKKEVLLIVAAVLLGILFVVLSIWDQSTPRIDPRYLVL